MPADDRLIVALDVPTIWDAYRIVSTLGDGATFYKIGYQLGLAGGIGGPGSSAGLARRRHHNALALGFDHDALGPAMAEALLHLSGTGGAPKAKRFLAVSIAHAFFVSFMAVSPPSSPPACPRKPASFAASSTTRDLSPPAASAACIARSRPNAKPISPAVKQPMKPFSPSGA